jgi:hypothetical protein
MPGFLYQTEDAGKRARQWRDRKRESVKDRAWLEEKDSVTNKIDHLRKHVVQMCEIN